MNNNTQQTAYSRWATDSEIKSSLHRTNYNGDKPYRGGIPLYADSSSIYVDDSDTHSIIIGSTGSKKTRLIGMPTLRQLAYSGESFIATDPKAELYEKIFPLLEKNEYQIFVLNLRDPLQSNCWNPFTIPYEKYINGQKDKAMELVTDLANCIVCENSNSREPYWENSASNLLAGLILIMFEYAEKNEIHFKSLRSLRTQAFDICERYNGEGIPFIRKNFLKSPSVESFLLTLLSGIADVCDVTRGCILSIFDMALRPFFYQDNLINMLSKSDFEMNSIGAKKTAVFLIIPDENTLYHRLVSVFVKQCYSELILAAQNQPSKKLPRRVNFLLDEFSTLPAINDFPAMITASRSRNIRFNLIIQSVNQLRSMYGCQAETIKGNCENWVFLHSRECELLKEISELCGNRNCDAPLVSASMLQTLDKDKGEVFVMHKRLYPFIANLLDIDAYPCVSANGDRVEYPENNRRARAVFDFEEYCYKNEYFEPIFTGRVPEEVDVED